MSTENVDKKGDKMQEVMNEIKKLYSLLEEKIRTTELLNVKLSEQRKEVESLNEKATARLKNASAMERIYKKYADFDKEKAEFDRTKIDYSKRIEEAKRQEENDAETLRQIRKEQAELDATKAMLNKQAIAIKQKEADFDKKKKELKAMISGEALKGMLE